MITRDNLEAMEGHLELMGFEIRDKVTGFAGLCSGICFDLYGRIQAIIQPKVDEKGDYVSSRYFDVSRLEVTSDERVIDIPDFTSINHVSLKKKGPTEKPLHD